MGYEWKWEDTNFSTFYFQLESKNNVIEGIESLSKHKKMKRKQFDFGTHMVAIQGKKKWWGLASKPFLVAEKWKTC